MLFLQSRRIDLYLLSMGRDVLLSLRAQLSSRSLSDTKIHFFLLSQSLFHTESSHHHLGHFSVIPCCESGPEVKKEEEEQTIQGSV
jgi:hypothetical protein